MKVKTKWDREVWCRDSAWETSTDEQQILIWGSEIEYALGSNVNEYITKGDLEFLEFDSDYTPAADNKPDLYDTTNVTLDNETITESTALVETPVISTEDRKEFVVGDDVEATIYGKVHKISADGTMIIVDHTFTYIIVNVDHNKVRKALVLTPGAVYRIDGHSFILTINNTFIGIDKDNAGHVYTLEEAQQLNVTKE